MVNDKIGFMVMVACLDAPFGNPKYLGGLGGLVDLSHFLLDLMVD